MVCACSLRSRLLISKIACRKALYLLCLHSYIYFCLLDRSHISIVHRHNKISCYATLSRVQLPVRHLNISTYITAGKTNPVLDFINLHNFLLWNLFVIQFWWTRNVGNSSSVRENNKTFFLTIFVFLFSGQTDSLVPCLPCRLHFF